MTSMPRPAPYSGPAVLSYGFRPFFLLGSLWAAIEVLVWLPAFLGEIQVGTVFAPRDWHELDDGTLVLEERKTAQDWTWFETRWIIVKGGVDVSAT